MNIVVHDVCLSAYKVSFYIDPFPMFQAMAIMGNADEFNSNEFKGIELNIKLFKVLDVNGKLIHEQSIVGDVRVMVGHGVVSFIVISFSGGLTKKDFTFEEMHIKLKSK